MLIELGVIGGRRSGPSQTRTFHSAAAELRNQLIGNGQWVVGIIAFLRCSQVINYSI